MMPMPHTNSHKLIAAVPVPPPAETSHVSADPMTAFIGCATLAVAGVVAARVRPLSADAQARVDAGGSSLEERRRAFRTMNWLDGGGW